jgi:hypothetical protein
VVLLGIFTAFEEDLRTSVTELMYGEPLRILGELLTPSADPLDTAHLITELCQHMASLRPILAERHTSPATFVHSDLKKFLHVFLLQDTTRGVLEPPYSGSYQALSWRGKTLRLLMHVRPVIVLDGVKPTYILNGTDRRNSTFNPLVNATPAIASSATLPQPSTQTMHSGRHIHFPRTLQHLSNHLHGGGGHVNLAQ